MEQCRHSALCCSVLCVAGWTIYSLIGRTRTSSSPPWPQPAESCLDYNASCLPRCAECERWSRSGCTLCARACHPQCEGAGIFNGSLAQLVQSRRPIRWLHFPKCGSTLGISILSYACTDTIPSWHTVGMALRGGRIDVRMAHAIGARHKTRGSRCGGRLLLPLEGHRPVSPHDTGLVAMFRKPSQRLISAFLDNYHAYGLARRERAALKARAPTISHFVRYPGIAGCVTKMLAGYNCAANVEMADGSVLRRALSVLRSPRFAFVGLVEEWGASICLLHRMLPGHTAPMVAEFRHLGHSINSHRGIAWLPESDTDGVYNESILGGFVDEADERVYDEAARIFRRHLRNLVHAPREMRRRRTHGHGIHDDGGHRSCELASVHRAAHT